MECKDNVLGFVAGPSTEAEKADSTKSSFAGERGPRRKASPSLIASVVKTLISKVEDQNLQHQIGNAQQTHYVRLSHLLKRAIASLPPDPFSSKRGIPLPPMQRAPLWVPFLHCTDTLDAAGETEGTGRVSSCASAEEEVSESAASLLDIQGGGGSSSLATETQTFSLDQKRAGRVVEGHQLVIAKLIALHFLHYGRFDLYETFW